MTLSITGFEFYATLTPIMLAVLALGAIIMEITVLRGKPRAIAGFIFAGLAVTLVAQVLLHLYRLNYTGDLVKAFNGQVYFDVYSAFFNYIFLIGAAVAVLMSMSYMKGRAGERGEYYILIVLATIGMSLMASANDLLIFFVGLETMSISVYVLVGIEHERERSLEGSIKYLLLGAFASAILLYGMALVYGMTGSLLYDHIHDAVLVQTREIHGAAFQFTTSEMGPGMSVFGYLESLAYVLSDDAMPAYQVQAGLATNYVILLSGIGLLLVGFFFKIAAVPFHAWTPDVYEGAPTPITGFMATAVKAAAFAALLRFVLTGLSSLWGFGGLYIVVYIIAVITMTYGNVTAIAQTNVKRMLAYSSIAHAGYMMVAVTAIVAAGQFYFMPVQGMEDVGTQVTKNVVPAAASILFYLMVYAFMNLGAFAVISALQRERESAETLTGLKGISSKRPLMAAVMAVMMLSLAGIPPFGGFAAKFYIFQSAVNVRLYVLAIIGVLNSVISAYYYLRVIVFMYMHPEEEALPEGAPVTGAYFAAVVMMVLVIAVGVLPETSINFVTQIFRIDMLYDIVAHGIIG